MASASDDCNIFCNDSVEPYYYNTSSDLNFGYYTSDTFNLKIAKKSSIELSLFHMNIRSLNKNSDKLQELISTIDHDFDVIVLSEIWSYSISLFTNLFPGYCFYYDLPCDSNVGGIGIYVRSTLSHCILDAFKIYRDSNNQVENIWMEVIKDCRKYIIGGIYRHPSSNINKFSEKMDNTLALISKQKLSCLIAGDINIDLKNFHIHLDTKAYLDTLILNNFLPVVAMPTRITERSATIIDHIYYSNGTKNEGNAITAGNFWSDITDHLPNFILLENTKNMVYKTKDIPLIRLYNPKNINKFTTAVGNIQWDDLYEYGNIEEAYNFFHAKITACHDECFKLVRMSRKCSKDKIWITRGLRKSINYKNKLYKKWIISQNPENENSYRSYLKILKKLLWQLKQHFIETNLIQE